MLTTAAHGGVSLGGQYEFPAISYHIYENQGLGDPINYAIPVGAVTRLNWTSGALNVPGQYRLGVRAFDASTGLEEQNVDAAVLLSLDAAGNDVSNVPLPPVGLRAFPKAGGAVRVEWICPTCDPKYASALRALINADIMANQAGVPWDGRIREMAYGLNCEVAQQTAFGEPHKNLTNTADILIGFLLAYTDGTGRYAQYQTFMTGLTIEALINYWDLTHDARVPYAVRRMLDDIWARYDTKKHALMYNGDTDPAKCGEVASWFNSDPGGNCGQTNHQGLNNLVSPAFAWYWRQTGDNTYLTRGDEVFAHSLDEELYSGKQFSQNYRWSFDYVNWRGKP